MKLFWHQHAPVVQVCLCLCPCMPAEHARRQTSAAAECDLKCKQLQINHSPGKCSVPSHAEEERIGEERGVRGGRGRKGDPVIKDTVLDAVHV